MSKQASVTVAVEMEVGPIHRDAFPETLPGAPVTMGLAILIKKIHFFHIRVIYLPY